MRTEALALVGLAAAEAPADPRVWYMKGVIVQQSGDRRGSFEAFSRALELQTAALPEVLPRGLGGAHSSRTAKEKPP